VLFGVEEGREWGEKGIFKSVGEMNPAEQKRGSWAD
jgi:hypothetical protein